MRRFDKSEHIENVNILLENKFMGMFTKRKDYADLQLLGDEIGNIKNKLSPKGFEFLYWSPSTTNTELYGGDEKMAEMMVKSRTKEFVNKRYGITYLLVNAERWYDRFSKYEYEKDGFVRNLGYFITMAYRLKNGEWMIEKTTLNDKPHYYSAIVAKETPQETYENWTRILDEMIRVTK